MTEAGYNPEEQQYQTTSQTFGGRLETTSTSLETEQSQAVAEAMRIVAELNLLPNIEAHQTAINHAADHQVQVESPTYLMPTETPGTAEIEPAAHPLIHPESIRHA